MTNDPFFSVVIPTYNRSSFIRKTIESVLTVVNGKPVYGAGNFEALAPKMPEILPDWSPVKLFGSYYKK